ncbi:response regulator transcription factor [Cognatilysobacter terrigena]|uniref:response regulator transcription factor n=1 Tax=Cognatilysobacter terrigena TaxID=2488749 RepID=UPI001414DC9C|nr:response regulator [Lysobacter terrigena]
MTDHRHPRALLVEDDAVSAAFLEAALSRVPLEVDVARDCARAREFAHTSIYALWVFDANLPDGRGDALLGTLRRNGLATPAIAHTAAREAEEHERLLTAGFLEVLVKPLSTSETVAAARMALGMDASLQAPVAATSDSPLWDDAAALAALMGDHGHLDALRGLFRTELDVVHASLQKAIDMDDRTEIRSHLHRLRASCGFVGATRLGQAAAQLAALEPRDGWAAFDAVMRATVETFPSP